MLVAAAQLSPAFLDRDATVERAVAAIHEAAARGARLIVFPEAFIPGYPLWVWSIPPGDTQTLRALYTELLRQAVSVPDATTERLCRAAREARILVVIGMNERNSEASSTSLFNSVLFIDAEGRLLGKRRKLVPTSGERLVHAMGDGSTFDVYDTAVGRLGGLICWENYMSLARHAMYCWGLEVLVTPTWDRGEAWLSTLRHVAREGRVYVIGCGNAMRASDVPDRLSFKSLLKPDDEGWVNTGDSAIVDPDGKFVTGPCHGAQEIIYGEIDLDKVTGPRWQLDVGGHYGRPDVFRLLVNRTRQGQLEMPSAAESAFGAVADPSSPRYVRHRSASILGGSDSDTEAGSRTRGLVRLPASVSDALTCRVKRHDRDAVRAGVIDRDASRDFPL